MEAIVEYNYVAQEPDELTLRKGDVIKEIRVMPGGWWEGTLKDKRGMFPDNFVKVQDPSPTGGEVIAAAKNEEVVLRNGGGCSGSGTGTSTGMARRWCRVLFSYEPCNEDELALIPQDSLEFLGEVEEGWWRGQLRGRVGVFPSNFVTPPATHEEQDKDKDKRELCRVLFPYEAANEDELTLEEGEVLTLLSRDAPDKGWWKGELRGRVGLFPDNFVEVSGLKSEHEQERHEDQSSVASLKGGVKYSMTGKRGEKAHARRSLDPQVVQSEGGRKSLISSSSSSGTVGVSGGCSDKKPINYQQGSRQLLISSAKRHVGGDSSGGNNINSNGSGHILGVVGLEEELDGVERGEGSPLFHPTASRAKAPRRRPPSTQHLRLHTTTTNTTTITNTGLANGTAVESLERLREDEGDGGTGRLRQKAPWVEELKLNQLERRKISPTDKFDKAQDNKRARNESRVQSAVGDIGSRLQEIEGEKEKEKEADVMESGEHLPTYVPYSLYSQLLEKVAILEEKQEMLQRTVGQLAEQLVPLLAIASANNKL